MTTKKKPIYLAFLIIFLFSYILLAVFFAFFFTGPDLTYPEGQFITPGNEQTEWIFAILLIPIFVLISAFVAIFFSSHIFLKVYVKSIARDQKIGLVQLEQLSGSLLWRRILIRSIILGFFISNICYTLASQQVIIDFWRSPQPNPGHTTLIPDPEVMFHLMWVLVIPCTLLLVPIWLMIDVGLVATKKVKGVEFQSASLASDRLYRIIKGYAGIGFMYNLIVMIIAWVTPAMTGETPENVMGPIMQILSPLFIIILMFPVVILIDSQQHRYRKLLWKTLQKLDMARQFIFQYDEKALGSLEDLKK